MSLKKLQANDCLSVIYLIASTPSTHFHQLQRSLSSALPCREHLDPRDRVLFDILDQGGTVRFRCGYTVHKADMLSEADASTCTQLCWPAPVAACIAGCCSFRRGAEFACASAGCWALALGGRDFL